jgi:hypothetical protein
MDRESIADETVNVPVAVVQTVGNNSPFKQGDVEVGIAYIG